MKLRAIEEGKLEAKRRAAIEAALDAARQEADLGRKNRVNYLSPRDPQLRERRSSPDREPKGRLEKEMQAARLVMITRQNKNENTKKKKKQQRQQSDNATGSRGRSARRATRDERGTSGGNAEQKTVGLTSRSTGAPWQRRGRSHKEGKHDNKGSRATAEKTSSSKQACTTSELSSVGGGRERVFEGRVGTFQQGGGRCVLTFIVNPYHLMRSALNK